MTYSYGKYDPFFHREWFKALRSGDYDQTKFVLKRNVGYGNNKPGFCCLGIICDMIDNTLWEQDEDYNYRSRWVSSVDSATVSLPLSIAIQYGILTELGVTMNDDGYTFEDIASAYEVMIP